MSRQQPPASTLLTLDVAAGTPVEPLRAHWYRHPVLGERPVVRLVGETAAPGEDAALAFLGFAPAEASEPLARAPRRALGFPSWVLVNDPARAGQALAVLKDMERAAHLARTKPGHAKDRYEALARRLPPAHPPSCGATTLRRKHTKPSSSSPWHAPAAACPHGRSCRNKRAASSFKQVAIPRPRKSASSASCWPCRPRAGPRPGSGGTAEHHCSTWPRAPPRCAARCSTCCPSRTARATSTAGGWTCWMRPARWTRSSCRPSRCRGSRRRCKARPPGSLVSSSAGGAGGGAAGHRLRSSSS